MDRLNLQFDELLPFRINQLSAAGKLTGQRIIQRTL